MKVVYLSSPFFTDNDICLLHHLSNKGLNVKYYIEIAPYNLKSTLFNIQKQYPKTGIFPASIYPDFQQYADYINLDNIYVVNRCKESAYHPSTIFLWIKLIFHIMKEHADVLYTTRVFKKSNIICYLIPLKKVLALHEPIIHARKSSLWDKMYQKIANIFVKKLVFFNKKKLEPFCEIYNYDPANISVARLGFYDYLDKQKYLESEEKAPYILFFGRITPYKGVKYLLDAMTVVHKSHPEVKLIVAGGGKIDFDVSDYKDFDYIDIRNRFIPEEELIGLLKKCLFSVAPYISSTQSGVLLTAFSLGVPMVLTDVGVFSEMANNEENGILVQPGEVDSLANGINKLLDNPSLISSMKKNIVEKWQKEMSWEPIADIFIDTFNDVIDHK